MKINNKLIQKNINLLWENMNTGSTTSGYNEMNGGTTISLSSSDYDLLLVVFVPNVTAGNASDSCICIKGKDIRLVSADTASTVSVRNLTYSSDMQYVAGSGIQGGSVQERRNVPIKIYGIKL